MRPRNSPKQRQATIPIIFLRFKEDVGRSLHSGPFCSLLIPSRKRWRRPPPIWRPSRMVPPNCNIVYPSLLVLSYAFLCFPICPEEVELAKNGSCSWRSLTALDSLTSSEVCLAVSDVSPMFSDALLSRVLACLRTGQASYSDVRVFMDDIHKQAGWLDAWIPRCVNVKQRTSRAEDGSIFV